MEHDCVINSHAAQRGTANSSWGCTPTQRSAAAPSAKAGGTADHRCLADRLKTDADGYTETVQAPRIRRCVTASAKQGDNGAAGSSANPLELNELTDIIR